MANLAILEAHPLCRLPQYFGAPLQCRALASIEIWHQGLHDAARADHARQGEGHIPYALTLLRQHGAGENARSSSSNSLRDAGKSGADPEPGRSFSFDDGIGGAAHGRINAAAIGVRQAPPHLAGDFRHR
jgi:hypothetical protein